MKVISVLVPESDYEALRDVPVLPGHRYADRVPDKEAIYDEIAQWKLDSEGDPRGGSAVFATPS